MMIKIILADDHKVVRKGLIALLSTETDFQVVGEVEDGLETIDLVERIKPDILVLDLMMPGLSGLEVTRTLINSGSQTGIVILSMHNFDAYVNEALSLGAKAYVLKDAPPEELMKAIREVAQGRNYLCSALAKTRQIGGQSTTGIGHNQLYDRLTPREKEILRLAVDGMPNKEIAAKLSLSTRTVETHRTNLMQKLNLHNHTQLIGFARKMGIFNTGRSR
jgi:two-component system, NarL family, response regulator NreC